MNSYASNQTRPLLLRILEVSNEFENEILPKTNDKPISVLTSIFIVSMDNLDLTTMDYQTDFYLYHEWKDSKLVHCSEEDVVLDVNLHSKIWVPDTYIVNSKQSHFHSVILANKKMQVAKDGLVKLRLRLTARASCPADLRNFPWDVQHCSLVLESYAYGNKDVEFVWAEDLMTDRKLLAPNIAISTIKEQINAKSSSSDEEESESLDDKDKKISLCVLFVKIRVTSRKKIESISPPLERYSGLYVILVMGPSLIIVCISWVTFLIGHDQHPARVSLGITSILTMEAIQLFIESSLPKVSYMTTLDVYSFVSYTFVLLAMTEYALVLIIVEKGAKKCSQKYGLGEQPPGRTSQLLFRNLSCSASFHSCVDSRNELKEVFLNIASKVKGIPSSISILFMASQQYKHIE
eukprot:gene13897-4847_t